MQKKIGIIFLLMIIILSFGFVFLKIQANGAENNNFNRNWRYKFARYKIFRKALDLHYDGDAKADYLGEKFKGIELNVVVMNNLYLDRDIVFSLAKKIEKITKKPTTFSYSIKKISFEKESNLNDLSKILQEERDMSNDYSNNAKIFLIFVNKNAEYPENIGSTLQEDGLVLFEDVLNENYSKNENVDLYKQYAISVLMHEFGHQLGLSHNEENDCLMNKEIEISNVGKSNEVVTSFCELEKKEISSMLF